MRSETLSLLRRSPTTTTIGVITGTGNPSLQLLTDAGSERVRTRFGDCQVQRGTANGCELVHISRHGDRHRRLSNHVNHRANVAALKAVGVDAVIGATVCGAVDPSIALGSLLVFDDLHFLANRLPDGSLCSFHDEPGGEGRGHWVLGDPFASSLRSVLLESSWEAGQPVRDGGVYGHVDGPRFNTKAEIRSLTLAGVAAVSQTAGPEAVLCGELEIPYALLGFATDYANGVNPDDPTPLEELVRLIGHSRDVFAAVLSATLVRIDPAALAPAGNMYRFENAKWR